MPSSFSVTYVLYRRAFAGFASTEIKLVLSWWNGLEEWLACNAPQILQTLNPPASDADIEECERKLKKPLPRMLKLLLKIHDGQDLLADNIAMGGRRQPEGATNAEIQQSVFYGLFGGYEFYEEAANVRLLSTQRIVTFSQIFNGSGTLARPPHPLDEGFGGGYQVSDLVVFASSFPARRGLSKIIAVSDSSGPVCNTGGFSSLLPCVSSVASGEGRLHGRDRFMTWLYEYLHRLQSGVYLFAPLSLHHPGQPVLPATRRMISLYPFVNKALRAAEAAAQGGYSSSSLSACGAQDLQRSCSIAISLGVEVSAAAIFVPEKSDVEDSNFFYSYQLSLRLLCGHPSRPPRLTTCSLTTRHWKIFSDDEDSLPTHVDGPGVIGLFPNLNIQLSQHEAPEEWCVPIFFLNKCINIRANQNQLN